MEMGVKTNFGNPAYLKGRSIIILGSSVEDIGKFRISTTFRDDLTEAQNHINVDRKIEEILQVGSEFFLRKIETDLKNTFWLPHRLEY